MKKISVVTGTRAEYGLLKPLIKLLNDDSDFDLQLMATAMHLSPEYGMTINEIINDGFPIVKKIECPIGVDIGNSKDPNEIALSIITRLISLKNSKNEQKKIKAAS